MRRLLSILLLLAFGLPGITPLFALSGSPTSGLPACCRRAGMHHCTSATGSPQDAPGVQAPAMRCPFCPSTAPGGQHVSPLMTAFPGQDLAPIASHPAGVAQTESKLRIAESRSRSKRGPPQVAVL